jgi:hypothetical protein
MALAAIWAVYLAMWGGLTWLATDPPNRWRKWLGAMAGFVIVGLIATLAYHPWNHDSGDAPHEPEPCYHDAAYNWYGDC